MNLRIDGASEGANLHLVIIASVDHHHLRVRNQGIPVLGFDVGAGHQSGADARYAKGHDFFFQPHLHAVKRRFAGIRLFVLQVGEQRVMAQIRQHGVDIGRGTGDRAVDALVRQQDQTLDLVCLAKSEQRRFAFGVVGQRHKLVKRSRQKN